ncbi:flippase [Halorubrum sp. SS5]|nr:flippase [Halorubrum sp. SS5]
MPQNISQRILTVAGSKAGAILVTVILTPILVRMLGSTRYGNYAAVVSMLALIMIFVDGGMFVGLRKFIAEEEDSQAWRSDIFSLYLHIAVLFAVIGSIFTVSIGWLGFASEWLGPAFRSYFIFMALLIPLRQLFALLRGALMGIGYETLSEPLRIISQILFAGFAIALVYFGGGVEGVLAGRAISIAAVILIGAIYVAKKIRVRSIISFSYDVPYSRVLSFNVFSVLLAFLTQSLLHVDIIMLQLLVGGSETGYYKAALVVAEFLWFVPQSIQVVFVQSSSKLWAENQIDRITAISARSTRYTLLMVLLFSIGLIALAKPFFTTYYGMEFHRSIEPFLYLLPGVMGFALARQIYAIGQGEGSIRILIWATGASAVINLGLNILLIPRYEMIGAATATSIGYGSMFLFHVIAARRIGFNPLSDLRIGRILITAGITAVPIYFLGHTITSNLVALLVVPPIGLVLYMGVAIQLGAISASEIREAISAS